MTGLQAALAVFDRTLLAYRQDAQRRARALPVELASVGAQAPKGYVAVHQADCRTRRRLRRRVPGGRVALLQALEVVDDASQLGKLRLLYHRRGIAPCQSVTAKVSVKVSVKVSGGAEWGQAARPSHAVRRRVR